MSAEYTKFKNDIRENLTVTMSPSTPDAQAARAEFEALTGTDDTYKHNDIWHRIYEKYCKTWFYKNMSLNQVQALHESDRIANPDCCVSIHTDCKCFIGNVTWNDQMKMFWEYETYTEEGAKIAAARKAECDALGKIAAWD